MICLMVNGSKRTVEDPPNTPLLWVLRQTLGLTGTNYSCCAGSCGSCTVYLDDQPVNSCVMAVSGVGERNVWTVEGRTIRKKLLRHRMREKASAAARNKATQS